MAYAIQQSVIDFHKKYGHPVRDTPQATSEEEADLAYGFIAEELQELHDALYAGEITYECDLGPGCCEQRAYEPNLPEVADALGDIIITAYGFAARKGIDMDLVLPELMRANNTKTANGQGKIKKTPGVYKAPDVAAVLARQSSPQ